MHRLIRTKGDGKVMELPSKPVTSQHDQHHGMSDGAGAAVGRGGGAGGGSGEYQNEDYVPHSKLETLGLEYTHLLTSQLESQRIYFENQISLAASKAHQSSAAAESSSKLTSQYLSELQSLRGEHDDLASHSSSLASDLERLNLKLARSSDLARSLTRDLLSEKEISKGLVEKVRHLEKKHGERDGEIERLNSQKEELEELNRDLGLFISGQEKLKEMEREGQVEQGEVEGGKVEVGGAKRDRKGKGRRK